MYSMSVSSLGSNEKATIIITLNISIYYESPYLYIRNTQTLSRDLMS